MVPLGRPPSAESIPTPGLLVLTGASHSGKTSVGEAILQAGPGPAALLAVDDVLQRTLRRPSGDIWEQIPLAYELITGQLKPLFRDSWLVLVESTFTYVPDNRAPEFHHEALERVFGEARSQGVPAALARLTAPEEVIVSRARESGRLDLDIVRTTVQLHATTEFSVPAVSIDTGVTDVAAAAEAALDALAGGDRAIRPGN